MSQCNNSNNETSESEFYCEICFNRFCLSKWTSHLETHKSLPVAVCDRCHSIFINPDTLEQHECIDKEQQLTADMSQLRYGCSYCELAFPDESLIAQHEKYHQYELFCKCLICDDMFDTDELLTNHLLECHNKFPYVCSICMSSFSSPECLNVHIKDVHLDNYEANNNITSNDYENILNKSMKTLDNGTNQAAVDRPYRCNICDHSFRRKDTLFSHMTKLHSINDHLACKTCNLIFQTSESLQHHLITNKCMDVDIKLDSEQENEEYPIVLECQPCDKIFHSIEEWNQHKIIHKTVECFSCHVCCNKFRSAAGLQLHIRMAHELTPLSDGGAPSADSSFTCSMCGKVFSKKSKLTAHEKTHTNEKQFKCELCNNVYSSKTNMMQHYKVRHSGVRPYVCSVCGKSFALSVYFRDHMQGHLGAKTHECEICHKRFRKKSYMKVHERTHTGAQPYLCNICNRPFAQKANLLKHAQLHTDKRSHNCSICKKGFTDSQALKRHMNTHTGNRPYVCSTCGQSYGTKGSLNVHMKFHEEVKQHTCSVCLKGFYLKSHLKRHLMTHVKDKNNSRVNANNKLSSKLKFVHNGVDDVTTSPAKIKVEELEEALESVSDSKLIIDEENVMIDNIELVCMEEVVLV
ncbi:hypothetical protein HELRODRAFT_112195 [Helobdella robusta]|uniref:C2H2-type domain-containing protein n=1 Tax=Helobdella robusta TaxID=6412 RepID=T1EFH6_HELRO|nr:hypothetical protein HELRODRAFT_112195 [Helobdella robusta]ESO03264.1 hypothetical protein HELRODRAFT_112195 [Helobdella robusta]